MKGLILPLLLGIALSAGLGVGAARFLKPPAAVVSKASEAPKAEAKADAHGKEAEPKKEEKKLRSGAVELPPVVASLAAPDGVWVRLEGSMVVDAVEEKALEPLKREVTSDMVAYLATLSLPQLQGSLGLQNLREDIEERIALRSKGRAKEFVIHMLVVQ